MVVNRVLVELGLKFRKARLLANLTQNELAARADKDQQSIQRLEKGKVNPSYLYMMNVCQALEMSLTDVIG